MMAVTVRMTTLWSHRQSVASAAASSAADARESSTLTHPQPSAPPSQARSIRPRHWERTNTPVCRPAEMVVLCSHTQLFQRDWQPLHTTALFPLRLLRGINSSTTRQPAATTCLAARCLPCWSVKPCPHCRRKVRLSQKTATVALFCDSVDRALS